MDMAVSVSVAMWEEVSLFIRTAKRINARLRKSCCIQSRGNTDK